MIETAKQETRYLIHPAEESDLATFGVDLADESALVLSRLDGAGREPIALDYDAEALRCTALGIDSAAVIHYAV